MKEIGRRDSTKFTLLRLEEVFVSKFPSIFESRVEKVKTPPLSNRIEQPNQVASRRRCHYPTLYQGSNTSTIFDRLYSLLTSTESTVAVERMERRNLLEPLPEPSTFFLRLLSSLPLSLSLGIYPLWSSLCVFTEIGEAAGSYFPADSVGRLQRLQILLRFSEPLSPAKPFAQFPLLLISFRRGEQQ